MNLWFMIFAIIALILGGDIWLYFVAFGAAKITGVNVLAALLFAVLNSVVFIALYTMFIQALDILNDFQADWAAHRNSKTDLATQLEYSKQALGLLQRQANAQRAVYGSEVTGLRLNQLKGGNQPAAGMVVDSDTFSVDPNDIFGPED